MRKINSKILGLVMVFISIVLTSSIAIEQTLAIGGLCPGDGEGTEGGG